MKYWLEELPTLFPCLLQHGAVKAAVQHSGANPEVHGQALLQDCPRSFPAEGSAMSKSPWNKLITALLLLWNCLTCPLLVPVRWATPPFIWKQFPKFLTDFPKLLLWGFGAPHEADQTTEMEISPRWLKHTFIFTRLTKQHPNLQERKVHKGTSISGAMSCIILTTCLLLEISTCSSPLLVHMQWPRYLWQQRLYSSNSHIKHSSSLTVTIQPNTTRENFEANRRNYLYLHLRHDPGGNMEATPCPQDMDLVPFPNVPGIGEHPQLQHSPHKRLHPRYNHSSATRDATIIHTSHCQTRASATFSQYRFMEVTLSMHYQLLHPKASIPLQAWAGSSKLTGRAGI